MPEAVVLEAPVIARPSQYPNHRDTLRPLRVVLVVFAFVAIAAGVAVATMVV